MALGVPNIATAAVRMVPDFDGFGKTLKSGLQANLSKGAIAGGAAFVALGAAGVTAAKAASNAWVPVETELSKIEGLVGASTEQVEEYKTAILGLAGDTARAPEELASAMFFITSAGLEGKAAIDALNVSAKASAAGLGDTATIADAVTSAMNAYGQENLSAANATDILTATVREGKAEASAIASSMGRIIPIAAQMGVSFDQVGGAIAAMTRLGLDANESTTALRATMTTLLNPSSEAEALLTGVGLSAEGLRDKLANDGLLPTLVTMSDAFDGNTEAIATLFPNVRAMTGVFNLIGENAGTTAEIMEELANSTGALDHAFGTVADDAGFRMEQSMAQIKAQMAELGAEVAPLLADLSAGLMPAIQSLLPPLVDLGKIIIDLAVALTPVVELIAKVAGTIIEALMPVLEPLLDIFGVLVNVLVDVMDTALGPLLEMLGWLADLIAPVLDAIGDWIGKAGEWVSSTLKTEAIIRSLGQEFEVAAQSIADGVKPMTAAREQMEAMAAEGPITAEAFSRLVGALELTADEAADLAAMFGVTTTQALGDMYGAMQDGRRGAGELGDDLDGLAGDAADVEGALGGVEDAIGGVGTMAEDTTGWLASLSDTFMSDLGEAVTGYGDIFNDAALTAETTAHEMLERVNHQLEHQERFADSLQVLMDAGLDEVVQQLIEKGPDAVGEAEALAADLETAFKIEETLEDIAGTNVQAMVDQANEMNPLVETTYTALGAHAAASVVKGLDGLGTMFFNKLTYELGLASGALYDPYPNLGYTPPSAPGGKTYNTTIINPSTRDINRDIERINLINQTTAGLG